MKDKAAFTITLLFIIFLFSRNILDFLTSIDSRVWLSFKEILIVVMNSWPLSFFTIMLIILTKFALPIENFLKNTNKLTWVDKAGRQYSLSTITQTEAGTTEGVSESSVAVSGSNNVERYEFYYLANGFLVMNSKRALISFLSGNTSLREFYATFYLPPEINNQAAERIAIINALQSSNLIANDGFNVSLTEKGNRFVQFLQNSHDPVTNPDMNIST